jgi:hypothetical protein
MVQAIGYRLSLFNRARRNRGSADLLFTSAISARSRSFVGIFPGVMAWDGVNGGFGETDRWIHPARAVGGGWEVHEERRNGM